MIGIAVILVIGGFWYLNGKNQQKGATNEPIKIGAVLPLTGASSVAGEQARLGMELAVETITQKGGIDGHNIELFIEDSKSSATEGVTAFNNLLAINNPNVIVSGLSSITMSLVPQAENFKTPLIGIMASVPNLANNEWVFRYYPTAKQEVPPILEMANNLGIKSISVLYLNDDFGKSFYDTTKEQFKGEVYGESFLISTKDFKTELTKIKAKKFDGILVVGFNGHIINALKQIKELRIDSKIFGPSSVVFQDVREATKNLGLNVYAGIPNMYGDNSDAEFVAIKNDFEKKFNKEFDHYSATGYDTIMLIKQAILQSGSSKEGIKNGLSSIQKFEGTLGSAEINGRDMSFKLWPAIIKSGTIEYLK